MQPEMSIVMVRCAWQWPLTRSSLYAIPDSWKPYTEDPHKKWPYERGQKCPPEGFELVRKRMTGMLLALTAYMIEHDVASPAALNFLCENALAFTVGTKILASREGITDNAAAAVMPTLPARTRRRASTTASPSRSDPPSDS